MKLIPKLTKIPAKDTVHRTVQFTIPEITGAYNFGVTLQNKPLPLTRHSGFINIHIEEE